MADGALIRYGDSRRQAGARWSWALAVDRYGPLGRRPDGEARRVAGLKRGASHWNAQKRACPKGHRYTIENTHLYEGRRYCKACQTLRRHQRRWRKLRTVHLDRLRAVMLAAHPDRGGTQRKFIEARRSYLRALEAA